MLINRLITYDEKLTFRGSSPFRTGQPTMNSVRDDTGKVVTHLNGFIVSASIVTDDGQPEPKITVYLTRRD